MTFSSDDQAMALTRFAGLAMRARRTLLLAGAATAVAAPALNAPALAADAAAAPAAATAAASDDKDAVSDIVVTATRTSQSLSKVAASVTAISADQLGAGGIKDVTSLAQAVPNLSVGNQFGVNRTFIRGIGLTSIDLGADGAVAFLSDSVLIPRPAAQLTGFFDLERVEVLRGPQGTLYGRSATAGAVNLVTKKPTDELSGYGAFTFGNYNAITFEGGVGGPIAGDKLMVRISGKYDFHDGYGTNLFTGNPVDDRNAWVLRGSLLFKPSDTLNVLVTVEHFNEHDNNYAFHYFGPTVAPENALGSILGGDTIITRAAKLGIPVNFRDTYSDQDAINRRHGTSVTATVEWTPGDWNVKSISAYRDFNRFNRDDLDASNVNLFGQNNYTERSKFFSQEFIATRKSDRWDVLLGASYNHENLFGSVAVPLTNLGLLFGLPADTFNDQNYLQIGTVYIDAFGIYGQATYALTDKLKITAGARYSYEFRKGVGSFQFLSYVPTDKSKGWGAVTPTFVLNYQATDATLLYASVTRGFKSGVINVGSQNPVIDPEYVWGYEAGIKTSALDGRLAGSVAGFYMDYSNLQVGFVGADSVVTTVNAASARNYGVEVELRAKPARHWNIDLFGTWLDAKYTDFTTGDYRNGFAPVNLAGKHLSNAPEFSLRAGSSYDFVMANAATVTLRADVNWQDRVYFTEFNNADATQGPYATINAGLKYTSANGRYSVDVWGRNLTDKYIIANNIITAPLYNSVRVGSLAPPRTFGVTLGANF